MDEPLSLSHEDIGIYKIGVTMAFAEKYGVDYGDAAQLFLDRHVFEYLEKHSGLLVTKMYPFVASLVAEQFGIPEPR